MHLVKVIFLCHVVLFVLITRIQSSYKIVSPRPFSIIRSNWLKIEFTWQSDDRKPDSVVYCLTYLDPGGMAADRHVVTAPFEYLLDCKKLHDLILYIKAEVYVQDTFMTLGMDWDYRGTPVIIDRKGDIKNHTHQCIYKSGNSKAGDFIRGIIPDTIACLNNSVTFGSAWDKDSLYLQFFVMDGNLNVRTPESIPLGLEQGYFKTLWTSDGIEICLDLKHDHNEWRQLDDYELITNILGEFQGNHWDLQKKKSMHWGQNVRVKVQLSGTPDDNSDKDSGYNVVMAIPWSDLDIAVDTLDTVGFDIQIFDLDSKEGTVFRTLWSTSELSNNDNPSEWGNLVLAGRPHLKSSLIYMLAGLFIILSAMLVLTVRIKKSGKQKHSGDEHRTVRAIRDYIQENYQDPELSREKIGKHLNLSVQYVGTLFKKETGVNLIDYLNKVRIEKASEMLKEPGSSINEIAFKTGYNTIQNFNKTFKKITGKTPGEFRSES